MSYALLLAPVLIVAALAAAATTRKRGWRPLLLGSGVIVALTIVFDNLMIAADLFRFDDAQLLGVAIGLMPVEDIAYAMIAVFTVTATWNLLGRRDD